MNEETMNKLKNVVNENLDKMQDDNWSKMDHDERSDITDQTCNLLEKLIEADGKIMDFLDKTYRREIEREKNETMVKIEEEKGTISKPKMILEIARIVVPVVVPMIAYGIYQKRLLEFEETGRVNSTAGRELHLPKFFK